MMLMAWYVNAPEVKQRRIDAAWWVCAVRDYMARAYPGGIPVCAAAAVPTTGKMSMGAVAAATFGPTGPGFIMLQLLLLAIVSYMIDWIATATNHKQFGSMTKLVALMAGFSIVVGSIFKALGKLWEFIG